MHARWVGAPSRADAIEVDLTVIAPPTDDHLHFWALQASFADGNRSVGAGHLGLQWIQGYPGHTAVNWGGYHSTGGILDGTDSTLPGALDNPHTRNYDWVAMTPYRLRIDRGANGWRGSVTDLSTGTKTVVRELLADGDQLTSFVMWSEVFAPCEGPSTAITWSNPTAYVGDSARQISQVQLSYQTFADGGCTNTSTYVRSAGTVTQRTAEPRTNPHGAILSL